LHSECLLCFLRFSSGAFSHQLSIDTWRKSRSSRLYRLAERLGT
jgi:hypothetical protein